MDSDCVIGMETIFFTKPWNGLPTTWRILDDPPPTSLKPCESQHENSGLPLYVVLNLQAFWLSRGMIPNVGSPIACDGSVIVAEINTTYSRFGQWKTLSKYVDKRKMLIWFFQQVADMKIPKDVR